MRFRYSIRMFAGMGELALARGDLRAARSHSAECLELATRTGSRKNLVKGVAARRRNCARGARLGRGGRPFPDRARSRRVVGKPGATLEIGARVRPFPARGAASDEAQHAFGRALAADASRPRATTSTIGCGTRSKRTPTSGWFTVSSISSKAASRPGVHLRCS